MVILVVCQYSLTTDMASEAIFGVLNKGLNVSLSIKKFQPARNLKLIRLLQSYLFLGPLSSRQGKRRESLETRLFIFVALQPLFGSCSDYVRV